MTDTYASLPDLENRLEWALSEDELRIAASALEDASDEARFHGRDWPVDTVPRMVRTLVLKACVRFMRNPDGYTQSRAGDETLGWSDDGERHGTPDFTPAEIKLLAAMAGKSGQSFSAVTVVGYGSRPCRPEGYVPVVGNGKPFPLFSSDESPW